eukprot:TRINITY_DN18733_c0_g1_i1.p1 TRINITY_DN18733_c0_g1~~TRINITY_DN18733_c0_g1_i1.p1  ORF type:complete len:546 (+),score=51.86 TRINITY_DN18733_c0_g1_i1:43-1638(+)
MAPPPTVLGGNHCMDSRQNDEPGIPGVVQAACAEADAMPQHSAEPSQHTQNTEEMHLGEAQLAPMPSAKLEIDVDVLRGVPTHRILSGFGYSLRYRPTVLDTAGKHANYSKSMPADKLHYFLSHAWYHPGLGKYIALMGYFRRHGLLVSSLLLSIICFVLELIGVLPAYLSYKTELIVWAGVIRLGAWSSTLVPPLALFIYFSTAAVPFYCRMDPLLVLDQVCIQQADDEQKRKGIESIGGFLNKSECLMILWGEEYFKRLWCVFEVACYLFIHGEDAHIVMNAVFIEEALLYAYMITWITAFLGMMLVTNLAGNTTLLALSTLIICSFGSSAALAFLHIRMQERRKLEDQLAKFDCQNTKCFLESDREFVYGSIIEWYGSLETFNELASHSLKKCAGKSKQRSGISYPAALCAMAPVSTMLASFIAGYIRSGVPDVIVRSYIIHSFGVVLLLCPVFIVFLFYLAQRMPVLQTRLGSIIVCLCTGIASAFSLTVAWQAWNISSRYHVAFNACWFAVFGVLLWWGFFKRSGY